MIEDAILWGALWWALLSMVNTILNKYDKGLPLWACEKCAAFWLTLIITFNPFIAAGAALTVWIIEKNNIIKL